jgi:hypothetical protein
VEPVQVVAGHNLAHRGIHTGADGSPEGLLEQRHLLLEGDGRVCLLHPGTGVRQHVAGPAGDRAHLGA